MVPSLGTAMASRCHCACGFLVWPAKSTGFPGSKTLYLKPRVSHERLPASPRHGTGDRNVLRMTYASSYPHENLSKRQPAERKRAARCDDRLLHSAALCTRSDPSTSTSSFKEAPLEATLDRCSPSEPLSVTSSVDSDTLAQPLDFLLELPPDELRGWRVLLQSSGEEIGIVTDIVDIEGASPLIEVRLHGIHASGRAQAGVPGGPTERKPTASALAAATRVKGGRSGDQQRHQTQHLTQHLREQQDAHGSKNAGWDATSGIGHLSSLPPAEQAHGRSQGKALSRRDKQAPATEPIAPLRDLTIGNGPCRVNDTKHIAGGASGTGVQAQGSGQEECPRRDDACGSGGHQGHGEHQGHGVDEPDGLASCLERTILVPLVADIVPVADLEGRCLHILPPEGLLEMADWKATLRVLNEELLAYCTQRDSGGEDGRQGRARDQGGGFERQPQERQGPGGQPQAEGPRGTRGGPGGARERPGWRPQHAAPLMPTESELQAAGKYELVKMIKFAGGFSSVAQTLGLRWKRRPAGYWDDLENVEREIDMFVRASWTEHLEDETGEKYYFNTATLTVAWSLPWLHDGNASSACTKAGGLSDGKTDPDPGSGSGGHEMDVGSYEDEFEGAVPTWGGKKILPTRACIQSAGRFDLHHAINAHGGYHAVRQVLDRCPPPRRTLFTQDAFEMEVADVMKAERIDRFPTVAELLEHDRGELLQEIKRRGGIACVARQMDLASARPRQVGYWRSAKNVVLEIQQFIEQRQGQRGGCPWGLLPRPGRMPTLSELVQAGRTDLRYAVKLHGHAKLANMLGLKASKRGRLPRQGRDNAAANSSQKTEQG